MSFFVFGSLSNITPLEENSDIGSVIVASTEILSSNSAADQNQELPNGSTEGIAPNSISKTLIDSTSGSSYVPSTDSEPQSNRSSDVGPIEMDPLPIDNQSVNARPIEMNPLIDNQQKITQLEQQLVAMNEFMVDQAMKFEHQFNVLKDNDNLLRQENKVLRQENLELTKGQARQEKIIKKTQQEIIALHRQVDERFADVAALVDSYYAVTGRVRQYSHSKFLSTMVHI